MHGRAVLGCFISERLVSVGHTGLNRELMKRCLFLVALIGFGFLWSGSAYITVAFRLLDFFDSGTVDLLVTGIFYVLQAVGIVAIALLFNRQPAFAGSRKLPFAISIFIVICAAGAELAQAAVMVVALGAVMNLLIGALSACYLTRLATDVPYARRGIVFGAAYALGSIGTWFLSMPMGGKLLWSGLGVAAVALLALISLILLRFLPELPSQPGLPPLPSLSSLGGQSSSYASHPESSHKSRSLQSTQLISSKNLILLATTVLFLLSLENTLGFSFPLKYASENIYIEFTRAFYALGLIIAGLVSDRSRRWGAICCLTALVFPFAVLALGGNSAAETVMWILAYLFLGFFSVYRILVFADISAKTGLPALAVIGLMAGRLGEAAGTLSVSFISGEVATIVFVSLVFVLTILSFLGFYSILYIPENTPEEIEQLRFFSYATRFTLSIREQDIFALILRGMSNAEISQALFITESTVKFHVGNVFKKVGVTNRSDLIADYRLRDRR